MQCSFVLWIFWRPYLISPFAYAKKQNQGFGNFWIKKNSENPLIFRLADLFGRWEQVLGQRVVHRQLNAGAGRQQVEQFNFVRHKFGGRALDFDLNFFTFLKISNKKAKPWKCGTCSPPCPSQRRSSMTVGRPHQRA